MTTNVSTAIPVPPTGPTAGATGTYSLWQNVLPAVEAARSALDSALTDTSAGHDHDGTDSKTVSHANLAGVTSGQHHAQAHAIGGADHSGLITVAQLPRLAGRVTSDLTASPFVSNTTLGNVTNMSVALAASSEYRFRAILWYAALAAADIKFAFTAAGVTALKWDGLGVMSAAVAAAATTTALTDVPQLQHAEGSGTALTFGGVGASTKLSVWINGIVRTAASAVTLQLQAAQGTSSATADTLYTDSHLIVELF